MAAPLSVLWRHAGPLKLRIARAVGMRLLQSFALGSVFAIGVLAVEHLASGGSLGSGQIAGIAAVAMVSLALQIGLSHLAMRDLWVSSYRVGQRLRLALLAHLRELPPGFHQARHRGDRLAALSDDIAMVEVLLSEGLPRLVQALSLPLIILIWLGLSDPRLALATGASILAAIPFLIWANARLVRLAARRQDLQAAAGSGMIEYVLGLPVIRACNRIELGQARMAGAVDAFRDVSVAMVARLTLPLAGFAAIVLLGVPLVLGDMGLRFGAGVSPSLLIATLLLLFSLYLPVLSLLAVLELTRMAESSLARVAAIFEASPLPEPAVRAEPRGHEIVLSDLGFSHGGQGALFAGLEERIPEGSLVAISGPSGSGKSSLLDLLARKHEVESGAICIGGVDLRDLGRERLRHLVHLEPQGARLLQGSIAQNIALARPDASRSEIVEAARLAEADGFIRALEHGYDNPVGEGGATLSGGERQRIAIARALLSDAPILLFDEITSALDPITEAAVLRSLRQSAGGRSVIIVAHRASVQEAADMLIELG